MRDVTSLVPSHVEARATKLSQRLPMNNAVSYICAGYRMALEDLQKMTPTEILNTLGEYVHE